MKIFILLAVVAAAGAASVSRVQVVEAPALPESTISKVQVVEAIENLPERITVKPSQSSTSRPRMITADPSHSSSSSPRMITADPSQSSTSSPRMITVEPSQPHAITVVEGQPKTERNQILIDILVRQLINYVRRVINNGSIIFGIPPLDPLFVKEMELEIPARLINLLLGIEGGLVTGVGGFVVNKSNLRLRTMTLDLDITVPRLYIRADRYNLLGDLFTAIPLYGDGEAEFVVENLRLSGLLHLKQSADEKSILIDWIERPAFELPSLGANLSGVIGGGNIDQIVNAIINEVIVDYVNRFGGAISKIGGRAIPRLLNPLLDQLDTWAYIERWV